MRQEVSVRSEELQVGVEWGVTLTQRSPLVLAPLKRQPEKSGVWRSLRPPKSAIAGVRPASSERAIAWFLTLVVAAMAATLHFRIFPELHALRAAASKHVAPAYPPSAVELDCFEAASRVARGAEAP